MYATLTLIHQNVQIASKAGWDQRAKSPAIKATKYPWTVESANVILATLVVVAIAYVPIMAHVFQMALVCVISLVVGAVNCVRFQAVQASMLTVVVTVSATVRQPRASAIRVGQEQVVIFQTVLETQIALDGATVMRRIEEHQNAPIASLDGWDRHVTIVVFMGRESYRWQLITNLERNGSADVMRVILVSESRFNIDDVYQCSF